MRWGFALAGFFLFACGLQAQSVGIYNAPAPPERTALERLNLKVDWLTALPLSGGGDGIALIQPIDGAQIVVQTKGGLVIALDALTGARQWTYRLPSQFVNVYPVGFNDRYFFVVNISRLIAFHRYSGLIEFEYQLPGSATVGPIADQELVYLVLNGNRLHAYKFPTKNDLSQEDKNPELRKPLADQIGERYADQTSLVGIRNETFTRTNLPSGNPRTDAGLGPNQITPSLSALPAIIPPYTLNNRGLYVTPSVDVLPNLRQPYQLRPEFLRYNQRTPSVGASQRISDLPELARFRPRGVQPELYWSYLVPGRVHREPILTDLSAVSNKREVEAISRMWLATDGGELIALNKRTGKEVVIGAVQSPLASPLVGPININTETENARLGFMGLEDGTLLGVDLNEGTLEGPLVTVRTNVGGFQNHVPVVTTDAVFASGEQSAVSRIELAAAIRGDVTWKTELGADRILAINDEFVYVRTRAGKLAVYDRKLPSDPETRKSIPLTTLDISRFGITPTNTVSDRILLAGDNGLIVSLRDASPKYLEPKLLYPVKPAKPAAKPDNPMMDPAGGQPTPPAEPKN